MSHVYNASTNALPAFTFAIITNSLPFLVSFSNQQNSMIRAGINTELIATVKTIPVELNAPDSISTSSALAVPNACDVFPCVKSSAIEDSSFLDHNDIGPKILPIRPVVTIKNTVIVSVSPSSYDISIPAVAAIDRGNNTTTVSLG